jgi:phospho-N-acetylmuramoyl-pentapeptide-transferase
MVFFAVVAYLTGKVELALLPAALVGGLIGYLAYNFHPAQVFMGDTGSLFLGGVVCCLAFALDMPLILILVGFVYIVETLSVILQVVYFKLTHGKRIFKMAPIHHHYEMCGWSEEKIVFVFAGVSALMCIIAWFGVSGRIG